MLMPGEFNVVDLGVDMMTNVSKVMHAELEYVRDATISQSRIRSGEKAGFSQSDAYRMNPAGSFFEVSTQRDHAPFLDVQPRDG